MDADVIAVAGKVVLEESGMVVLADEGTVVEDDGTVSGKRY